MIDSGKLGGALKHQLGGEMRKDKAIFEKLNSIKTQYEEQTHTDSISDTERQKRIHQIEGSLAKYKDLQQFLDNPAKYKDAQQQSLGFKHDLEEQRDARDGEYSYTRNATNQELMQMARQKDKQFNNKMGKVADSVNELKQEALNQKTMAGNQLKITRKINERVEQTEVKMKKIDTRLDKFVANSSDKKVWCYIAIQSVILLTLIIVG